MDFDQAAGGPSRPRRQLPTFYYHAHFSEMLSFVARHYAHVLGAEETAFIEDFGRLPRRAQCLYVRLANRKGRVFDRHRLRYPELGDTGELLPALRENGWIRPPGPEHFDELLGFLTRAEIHAAVAASVVGAGRSMKKAELAEFARRNVSPGRFLAAADTARLFVQCRSSELGYLCYLYFGRIEHGLSKFTMRDLGLVRTQSFVEEFEPRFEDRDEALTHYYFASRVERAKRASEHDALCDEADGWPEPAWPGAARLRDRLVERLGRAAEKRGDRYAALRLYQKGGSAAAVERIVRLLLANGERDEARAWLERCLEQPQGDEAWLFARDVYEQKFGGKRTSSLTDVLRAAEIVEIDESLSGAAERAAAEWFERRGIRAFWVENALWRTFFGLLFWDVLYAGEGAALHSPFEFLPKTLADGTFAARHADAIVERLALLERPAVLKRELLKTTARHHGTTNGVFRWRKRVIEALMALVDHGDAGASRKVLEQICASWTDARHGWPDLMLVDGEGVRFAEIKAEGDQVRRNQLARIVQLREAGFRADVVRLRFALDPEQAYVVVDVETTGGTGETHRVTEIGAVKVKNGRIVDRFETLVNPLRTIPPNITRLTGITPAMVADAPPFADVADELEAFIGDAIFVAHNVGFDYRFIASEFARLGRPFRRAKLCTFASMRRLYPGYRSYSLAALCEQFGIPLRSHHRALCDAEAAAELLLLVNEKRSEALAAARDQDRAKVVDVGQGRAGKDQVA